MSDLLTSLYVGASAVGPIKSSRLSMISILPRCRSLTILRRVFNLRIDPLNCIASGSYAVVRAPLPLWCPSRFGPIYHCAADGLFSAGRAARKAEQEDRRAAMAVRRAGECCAE